MKNLIKEIYHSVLFLILSKTALKLFQLSQFIEYTLVHYLDEKAAPHYTPRLEHEAEERLEKQELLKAKNKADEKNAGNN